MSLNGRCDNSKRPGHNQGHRRQHNKSPACSVIEKSVSAVVIRSRTFINSINRFLKLNRRFKINIAVNMTTETYKSIV